MIKQAKLVLMGFKYNTIISFDSCTDVRNVMFKRYRFIKQLKHLNTLVFASFKAHILYLNLVIFFLRRLNNPKVCF